MPLRGPVLRVAPTPWEKTASWSEVVRRISAPVQRLPALLGLHPAFFCCCLQTPYYLSLVHPCSIFIGTKKSTSQNLDSAGFAFALIEQSLRRASYSMSRHSLALPTSLGRE